MTDANDDDDFLALPKPKRSRPDRRAALKLPDEVHPPADVAPDTPVEEWWPYYVPSRDGRHIGRPRTIQDPQQFDDLVDLYFEKCCRTKTRPTMTGLLLELGFSRQQSLTDYVNRYGDTFAASVSRARAMIKLSYETNLIRQQGSVQGVMFALRNFGRFDDGEKDWEDTTRTELTGKDGNPIAVANAIMNLDKMSDTEKATRLYHLLSEAVQTQDEDPDDDDPLQI